MKILVVPVVDSPAGRLALDLARQEARDRGAELVLVGTAVVSEHVVENVEAVRQHMADVEKELTDDGFICRSEWSVGGSLGDATLEAARKHDAERIVVGLRHRSAVGKALLGSYEQQILLDAPCPVLSVHAPLGR